MKTQKDIINGIITYGAERCTDLCDGIECADLHHELYNTDYYTIGRYEATQELAAFGTFDAIGIIQRYENDNFGEVITDLTEPERIINMLAYIIGEIALTYCDTWHEFYDEQLKSEQLELINKELLALTENYEFHQQIENL